MRFTQTVMAIFLVGSAAATPANARTVAFTGTEQNINPVASLVGRCAPNARTVIIGPTTISASGTSNFGDFAPTESHCIVPPLPTTYSDGLFSFAFNARDTLTGTYTGALGLSGVMGTFVNVQNYIVTGGTGRFVGSTGAFTGTGTVSFQPGGLGSGLQTFGGRVNLVPEPAAGALLLAGIGCALVVARRGRARTFMA